MEDTLKFDPYRDGEGGSGWTSRFSFLPEWMEYLNNDFYSFNNGDIFIHHSENVPRCEFYGVKYPCTITTDFNEAPLDKKQFKTVHIDSDYPWEATLDTDLGQGHVDVSSFVKKEGDWFAYIRQDDALTISQENATSTYTQGVGVVQSYLANVITFSTNIDTSAFAVGDRVYKAVGSTFIYFGDITAYSSTSITVSGPAVTPVANDFIVVAKNRIAESTGIKGYYMRVTLENNNDEPVELFAVSSSIFKSYP